MAGPLAGQEVRRPPSDAHLPAAPPPADEVSAVKRTQTKRGERMEGGPPALLDLFSLRIAARIGV